MWLWILGIPFALALLFAVGLLFFLWKTRYGFRGTGRIEGTLFLEGKAAPAGQWVACHISRAVGAGRNGSFSRVMWNEYAQTSEGGRFVFKRIPVGEVGLGQAFCDGKPLNRLSKWNIGDPSTEAKANQEARLSVLAGETCTVTLGKEALTLRGRFVLPDDIEENIDWSLLKDSFMMAAGTAEPEPPEGLLPRECATWRQDFMKSEEGLSWRAALQRSYHVRIDSDGHFTIHNVYPGTYTVHARVDRPNGEIKNGSRRPLGTYEGTIQVIAPSDDTAVSMELGNFPMTHYSSVGVTSFLPDRVVHTVEGDAIDLASFRGKFLLLYLWWDSKFKEKQFLVALAKLEHQFENATSFEILGLDMDPEDSNAWYWMTEIDEFFDHHDVVEEERLPLSSDFAVRETTLFLVDPEGQIVAIEAHPKAMRAPLKRLLRSKGTATKKAPS